MATPTNSTTSQNSKIFSIDDNDDNDNLVSANTNTTNIINSDTSKKDVNPELENSKKTYVELVEDLNKANKTIEDLKEQIEVFLKHIRDTDPEQLYIQRNLNSLILSEENKDLKEKLKKAQTEIDNLKEKKSINEKCNLSMAEMYLEVSNDKDTLKKENESLTHLKNSLHKLQAFLENIEKQIQLIESYNGENQEIGFSQREELKNMLQNAKKTIQNYLEEINNLPDLPNT